MGLLRHKNAITIDRERLSTLVERFNNIIIRVVRVRRINRRYPPVGLLGATSACAALARSEPGRLPAAGGDRRRSCGRPSQDDTGGRAQ